MNKLKLKVNDLVKITAGKDNGNEGKIEMILPKKKAVVVAGANVYKKHVKGMQGQKGGIYDLPRPLNISKVALICPSCKKQTRVGYEIVKDSKVRICKKCKKQI